MSLTAENRESARDERHVESWRLSNRAFVVSIGLIVAVQMVAAVYLLRHSFFFADDYIFLDLFDDEPVGDELLLRSIFGHMVPALILVQKAFGTWFGANWVAASVLTLLVQLGGSVAFLRLLVALHGRAWFVPLVTAGFSLSVVMLNNAPWWSATWTMGATVVCAVSAWGCAVRYANTRRARHLVSLFVMLVLSFTFFEKSMALCVYVGLFALFVGARTERESLGQRVRGALSLWRVWAIMAVVAGTDLVFFLRGGYLDEAGDPPSVGVTLEYLARCLPEGVFPSLLGIAYPDAPRPGPDVLLPIAATVLIVGVMAWSSWRSSLARRTWCWFLVCVVFSQVLVARGRLGLMELDAVIHMLRYQVDATYLFLVAVSVALPAAWHASPRVTWSPRKVGISVLLALVLLAPGWVQSVRSISENSPGRAADTYFAALRHDRAPSRPFLDLPVPDEIVPSNMYPWNMASLIHQQINPGAQITDNPRGAVRLDPAGGVQPVALVDLTEPSETKVCAATGDAPVAVLQVDDMFERPPDSPALLVLSYRSRGAATISLSGSTPTGDVDLSRVGKTFHLAERGQLATVAMVPDLTQVNAHVLEGDRVCFTDVRLAVFD